MFHLRTLGKNDWCRLRSSCAASPLLLTVSSSAVLLYSAACWLLSSSAPEAAFPHFIFRLHSPLVSGSNLSGQMSNLHKKGSLSGRSFISWQILNHPWGGSTFWGRHNFKVTTFESCHICRDIFGFSLIWLTWCRLPWLLTVFGLVIEAAHYPDNYALSVVIGRRRTI